MESWDVTMGGLRWEKKLQSQDKYTDFNGEPLGPSSTLKSAPPYHCTLSPLLTTIINTALPILMLSALELLMHVCVCLSHITLHYNLLFPQTEISKQ